VEISTSSKKLGGKASVPCNTAWASHNCSLLLQGDLTQHYTSCIFIDLMAEGDVLQCVYSNHALPAQTTLCCTVQVRYFHVHKGVSIKGFYFP
jgi:hypothetical protein